MKSLLQSNVLLKSGMWSDKGLLLSAKARKIKNIKYFAAFQHIFYAARHKFGQCVRFLSLPVLLHDESH